MYKIILQKDGKEVSVTIDDEKINCKGENLHYEIIKESVHEMVRQLDEIVSD